MGIYSVILLFVTSIHLSVANRYESTLETTLEPKNAGDCSRFVYEYGILEKLIKLEAESSTQLERIKQFEKQQKKPTVVSAHVRLSKTTTVSGNERVKYDVEISNIGGSYDLKNGQFTAPVPGLYLIHVQLCLGTSGHWMDLNIVKEGAVIGRVFSGDHAYHSCGSELLNVHLNQGDTVWVVREAGLATSLNQDHGWNSFKAVLLLED